MFQTRILKTLSNKIPIRILHLVNTYGNYLKYFKDEIKRWKICIDDIKYVSYGFTKTININKIDDLILTIKKLIKSDWYDLKDELYENLSDYVTESYDFNDPDDWYNTYINEIYNSVHEMYEIHEKIERLCKN